MRIAVVPTDRRELVCAVCKDPLEANRWHCDGCGTLLHPECRNALAVCPSLGCGRPRPRVAGGPTPAGPRGWLPWVTGAILLGALALGFTPRAFREVGAPPAAGSAALPPLDLPAPRPIPRPLDLSHVRPGQEWVFTVVSGLAEIEQVYRIEAVEPERVRASLRTRMRRPGASCLTDAGEAVPFVWERGTRLEPAVSASQARVTRGGREWECVVTEVDGTTSWCPTVDQEWTFPPWVWIESDHMRAELREIREPR